MSEDGLLRSSLKNRIVLVAALLFLLVSRILYADMQAMVSKQQLTTAEYIARDIDGKIKLRLDSLQRVALNVPENLFPRPAELQVWLEDRRAIHTLFPTGLMVIPTDGGSTLAETPKLSTRPKSFVDRDWFIGVMKTHKPYVSKPLIARATGEAALVIAVPVLGRNGQIMAVLAGVTPLAVPGFLDLIIGTRPGARGEYQLISPQDHLFALTSDSVHTVARLPAKGEDLLIDMALAGTRGARRVSQGQNPEELAAIVDIPQTGWFLLARQPAVDAFEPVSNTLRNTLLITIVLALPLLAILLAVLRRMFQPFATVAGELHDMAEGRRPMHPLATQGSDEVGHVVDSFNRLQGKLQEQEQRLREMAHHDTLTGLPNRLTIMERLESELLRFQRTRQGLALLFLDLDGFKPVNDAHGHQIGDQLLCEIARRLRACVRDIDTVARLGGDEFLILLSATELPMEAAERVAQECILSLQSPIRIGTDWVKVGVSIGIAVTDSRADTLLTATQLVSQSDQAMYQAKADGRNCYRIFSQPSTENA